MALWNLPLIWWLLRGMIWKCSNYNLFYDMFLPNMPNDEMIICYFHFQKLAGWGSPQRSLLCLPFPVTEVWHMKISKVGLLLGLFHQNVLRQECYITLFLWLHAPVNVAWFICRKSYNESLVYSVLPSVDALLILTCINLHTSSMNRVSMT